MHIEPYAEVTVDRIQIPVTTTKEVEVVKLSLDPTTANHLAAILRHVHDSDSEGLDELWNKLYELGYRGSNYKVQVRPYAGMDCVSGAITIKGVGC